MYDDAPSWVAYRRGRYREAAAELAAIAEADRTPSDLVLGSRLAYHDQDHAAAERLAALALAHATRAGDERLIALASSALGAATMGRDAEGAARLLDRATSWFSVHGPATELEELYIERTVLNAILGNVDESRRLVTEALDGCTPLGRARLLVQRAELRLDGDGPEQRMAMLDEAVELARELDHPQVLAKALRARGMLRTKLANLEAGNRGAGERDLRAAMDACGVSGAVLELGLVRNGLAELFRSEGRLEDALEAYNAAAELLVDPLVDLNRSLVLQGLGRWDAARQIAEEATRTLRGRGLDWAVSNAVLLPCLAHDGDAAVFRARHHVVQDLVGADWADDDVVHCLLASSELWLPTHPELAARAWATAAQLADAIGDPPADTVGFLGPYDLVRPVGEGGMGQVWAARHELTGQPAAVKVLTRRHPSITRALGDELETIAALDHPGIVRVLRTGVVRPEEAALAPSLLAGTPWFAMELAAGGTLEAHPPTDWFELRRVVRALLGALAYAHARGVLHLDVKPANVLLHDGEVRLTDFGLTGTARAETRRAVGTPAYMAPEQHTGDVGRFGPWTDLYALGCTVTHLASGMPPFFGSASVVRTRHLSDPPPPLNARYDVPDGLSAWLLRCMAKAPAARFPSAAAALAALEALQTEVGAGFAPAPSSGGAMPTYGWITEVVELEDLAPDAPPTQEASPWLALPPDWRDTEPERTPPPVDLALLPYRRIPVVGRDGLRDALWGHARDALSEAGAVVRLRGPEGSGRAALAAWLGERCAQAGAASHWRGGGPELLRDLLRQRFRSPRALRHWARAAGGEDGRARLLGAVFEGRAEATSSDWGAFFGLAEPAVLWLEGPRTGDAARAARAVRVLVLTPEDVAADAEVVLDRLGPDALGGTLRALAPVHSDVIAEVLDRCHGHLGAAAELVRSLADGHLMFARTGWALRPCTEIRSDAGPRAALLDALDGPTRTAVLAAALLGGPVPDEALVDPPTEGSVLSRTAGGWLLCHPGLGAELQARASEDELAAVAPRLVPLVEPGVKRGRLRILARDFAAGADEIMVAMRSGSDDIVTERLLAEHDDALRRAGVPPDDPRHHRSRCRRGLMALHSGARETARRLCRPWHPSMQPVAGYLALLDGDLDRAEEILAEEPVADPWLRGHATRIAALVALHRMELGRAEELLRAAVQEPAETGWQAQVHAELAHVLALRRAPGARVALERAEAATLRFGLGAVASVTRLHVALLAWEAGDASGAVSELEEAGALVEPGAAQHAAALLLAAAVLFGTQRPERAEALLGVLPALDPGWGDVFLVRALVEGLRTGAPSAQLGERVRGLPLVLRSTALPLLLRLCAERYPSGPAREACAEVADALWRQLEAARAR